MQMREREPHTHTHTLSLSFWQFVSCLLYLVPFFLAAFFLGAPTRRIHKPHFVWHIDRWGCGGAGHEGRTKAREKGRRLGKKVGRYISGCKSHDWDHVFLFFLELHDLGQARNERQHVFYWLACKVKERKALGVLLFFYLDRKVNERKALCVCLCVCVFYSVAK
jgi:hypothetical protein